MDQPKGCSKLLDGSVWARAGARATPSRELLGVLQAMAMGKQPQHSGWKLL